MSTMLSTQPTGSSSLLEHSKRESASAVYPDAALLTKNNLCTGCKKSVVGEHDDVVVAFGQSLFHLDCFRCAKCNDRVTAETNLPLLSDGSPICSNCSYCCSVCQQPILDEAVMAGDDSYHAHCFKCKVCKKRIDDIVFAKAGQSIYCMDCHSHRVAKSRRRQQEKAEKEERERAAKENGSSSAPKSHPSPESSHQRSKPSSRPGTADSQAPQIRHLPSIPASQPTNVTPTEDSINPPTKRGSASSVPDNSQSRQQQNGTSSNIYTNDSLITPPNSANFKRHSSLVGLPTSPARRPDFSAPGITTSLSASSAIEHARSVTSPPLSGGLSVPISDGRGQTIQKRRSFDDGVRPLNILLGEKPVSKVPQASSDSTSGSLSPDAGTARVNKRRSILPSLVSAYNGTSATTSPVPSRAHTPDKPNRDHSLTLPPQPYFPADTASSQNGRFMGRARSSSTTTYLAEIDPEHTPLRSTPFDMPARTSSLSRRADGRASPAGSLRSTDGLRANTSARRINGSPRGTSPSPSYRADVPHGIESGTDTEAETDEGIRGRKGDFPPHPPPKEFRNGGPSARPLQLHLDTDLSNDSLDTSQLDSEDLASQDSESPVERTSHATFIAPALPPIRISIGGTDFSDLFKSVGQQQKFLEQLGEVEESTRQADTTQAGTPTSNVTILGPDSSLDATPKRGDVVQGDVKDAGRDHTLLTSQLENGVSSKRPFMNNSQETNGNYRSPGERHKHNPSESSFASIDTVARITVTGPDNATTRLAKTQSADVVTRRLREVISDATDRGASHVKLDMEFVKVMMSLLDERMEEYADLKRRFDGAKRASQRYMDGIDVAQTEYDRELQARRNAEAEVTRLRVLLSGQAARLTAIAGDSRRQEAQRQLSRELSDSLTALERDLSKLKAERDLTLAEVEELSATKRNPDMPSDLGVTNVTRALSTRFDSIKHKYQHELIPLTAEREALIREITELKASREAFLEETTMLNARNEELAQLNAQYARRIENAAAEARQDTDSQDTHESKVAPSLTNSVTSTAVAHSDESAESKFVKVHKSEASEPGLQFKPKFKWPGTKAPPKEQAPPRPEVIKPVHHSFQQVSVLRVARCDHCGEKMWGSQLRCTTCNISVHTRCFNNVQPSCQQSTSRDVPVGTLPMAPSMFGRDLSEQVRAESKDEPRHIPIIVEKCIEAVDTLALDYEGIYRKTGGSGQSKTITQLFDRGDYKSFDLLDSERFNDICSVTSVLKNYFRMLPDPLFTYALHDRFIAAASAREAVMRDSTLSDLVNELPSEHYHTTRAFMLHLHRVCQHSETNLMHARNLGVVFGPTLMRSRDPNAEFSDMAGKALMVEWLVENAPTVFGTAPSP